MARKTIKDLEQEIKELQEEANTWMQRYNELQKQVIDGIEQTDVYKDLIRRLESERTLAEVTNDNYVFISGKLKQVEAERDRLYEDNKRLLEGYRPGCTEPSPEQQQYNKISAALIRLSAENQALREQLQALRGITEFPEEEDE